MLTYELKKAPGVPLYEALYRCIRSDILSGRLAPGQKMPSKRALSTNLGVSKITVEGAYSQLLSEGYIRSVQKVGYFVEQVAHAPARPVTAAPPPEAPQGTSGGLANFPFSVWSRLQREVMQDLAEQLLLPLDNQGCVGLRQAIAGHLADFRGLQVDPACIIIGAGTDFLYNLLVQLLGRDKRYAVEEPGYSKVRRIYAAAGAACIGVPLDELGVDPSALADAQVLHISPSHHFPTGLVTAPSRRLELLAWAAAEPGRWLIEDDYDSEFRFNAHPMPAMYATDRAGRVIYMNSFSKTLAPSIRISYMVLPPVLMERFRRTLGFYSCTVPSFEQYTLERFLRRGYFEKHINRMRRYYKTLRDRLVDVLSHCGRDLRILEKDAGLHFLVRTERSSALQQCFAAAGIRAERLESYYHGPVPDSAGSCLVVNYSDMTPSQLEALQEQLERNV